MSNFLSILEMGSRELDLFLSHEQKQQCERYFKLLVEWNGKINLTAIKEEKEIATKHFLDSLAAGQFFEWDKAKKLLDLGSGAGFPGLVLKIWQPNQKVTLVDAVQKKVRFLNLVYQELGLQGVEALHIRAEDLGRDKNYRENYDLVVARAVAPLVVLSEYCLPLLTPGGYFYALKGPNYEKELREAKDGIRILGGIVEKVHTYTLPLEGDERSLVVIRKTAKTPGAYPRKRGLPSKNPLGVNSSSN